MPGLRWRGLSGFFGQPWRQSPPVVLAGSFLLLIVIGAILLKMPVATVHGITWRQSFFTSCSAVTVTGLVVVNTGTAFTAFGQSVILVLIQLGGIGVMTFAALTVLLLSGRLGLRGQRLIREAMNQTSPADMGMLLRRVGLLALVVEGIGMLLLAADWVPNMGWRHGLWFALFHSISAFNNAGFGLRGDSLTPWAGDPLVTIVITSLFVIGGLGFTVLVDLGSAKGWRRLTLHSKLTLSGTAFLALSAFLLILLFEWDNPRTLGALPDGARWWAAWFQALTPRTAGFNTVNIGALTTPTTLLMILLMFVGGGSNSTASGIKVSTGMVLLLSTRAFLLGRNQPHAFGRSIPMTAVFRAQAVTMLSLMLVLLTIFVLTIIEPHLNLLDLAFEAFSAFGTVGLSRGITTHMSEGGQALLMMLMFVGRIGPLALAFALARPQPPRIRYAEDDVQIG